MKMTPTPRNKDMKCVKGRKRIVKQKKEKVITKAIPRRERSKGNMEEGKDEGKEETKGRTNKKKRRAAHEGQLQQCNRGRRSEGEGQYEREIGTRKEKRGKMEKGNRMKGESRPAGVGVVRVAASEVKSIAREKATLTMSL
jgi:hypothetical protein